MDKLEIKMPNYWDDAYQILHMKRGQQRRMSHHLIVIETLRALGDQMPTRDQLQATCRIRRARFVAVLAQLIESESVERIGAGTKFKPFRYRLAAKERR